MFQVKIFTDNDAFRSESKDAFMDKYALARELEFNYIIEFDRANANDAVFYECANDEFEAFITKEFYKTNFGSYSDICEVAPALGCAAVNLSCGCTQRKSTLSFLKWKEASRKRARSLSEQRRPTSLSM